MPGLRFSPESAAEFSMVWKMEAFAHRLCSCLSLIVLASKQMVRGLGPTLPAKPCCEASVLIVLAISSPVPV